MQVLVARGRRVKSSSSSGKKQRASIHEGSRVAAIWARDRSELSVRLGRWCATIASNPGT